MQPTDKVLFGYLGNLKIPNELVISNEGGGAIKHLNKGRVPIDKLKKKMVELQLMLQMQLVHAKQLLLICPEMYICH